MVMARGPRRQAFASTDANASIASQRSRIVVSRTPSHTREVLRDGSDGPNPDAHDGAGHPVGQRPDEAALSDPRLRREPQPLRAQSDGEGGLAVGVGEREVEDA